MSIYSDYKCGALTDEEFKALCIHENEKDRYDLLIEKQEYYTDDDFEEESEETNDKNNKNRNKTTGDV